MTVSELAKRAGMTAETVRHYTRSGLLTPQRQKQNGYYYYGDSDLVRLLFIRKARLLGFGLDDVTEILHMSGYGQQAMPVCHVYLAVVMCADEQTVSSKV